MSNDKSKLQIDYILTSGTIKVKMQANGSKNEQSDHNMMYTSLQNLSRDTHDTKRDNHREDKQILDLRKKKNKVKYANALKAKLQNKENSYATS